MLKANTLFLLIISFLSLKWKLQTNVVEFLFNKHKQAVC